MSETAAAEPLVSVIIPVYNAEKYLRETLDCVCNQTLRNIEIICVDDGSTDASLAILQEYAARDGRFRILQQKNQYAGVARNNGMAAARGKYLSFLDADDLFEPDMLEKLSTRAEETGADIVICDARQFNDDDPERATEPMPWIMYGITHLADEVFHPAEALGEQLFQSMSFTPWNKLYSADFIRRTGNRWQETPYANDVAFVGFSLFMACTAALVPCPLIRYRVRHQSLSHNKNRDFRVHLQAWGQLKERIAAKAPSQDVLKSYYNAFLCHLPWYIESLNPESRENLCNAFITEYDSRTFHLMEQPESLFADKRLYRYVRSFFLPEISFALTEPDPAYLPELLRYFDQFSTIIHELLVVDPGNNVEVTDMLQRAMETNIRLRVVPMEGEAHATMEACRRRMRAKRYAVLPKGMLLRPGIMSACPQLCAAKGTEGEIDIRPLLRRQSRNRLFRQLSVQKQSLCLFGKPFFTATYGEKGRTCWLMGCKIWKSKQF